MWHPRRWRLGLVCGLGLLLLASAAVAFSWIRSSAGAPDHPSLRSVVDRFYQSQARRDVDAFVSLWDPEAPDLPARRTQLKRVLATYEPIEIGRIEIADLAVTDAGATIEVHVEMRALEPATGELAEGFGQLRRVMECVRSDGTWKVAAELAIEERLAEALLELASDEERAATLAAAPDASMLELFRAFVRRAENERRAGEASKALDTLARARRLAKRVSHHTQAARMLAGLGRLHLQLGDYGAALDSYTKALPALEAADDREGQAEALGDAGWVHLRLGDYPKALDTLRQSIALREAAGHQASTGRAVRGIGAVYLFQGDNERAGDYFGQALSLGEQLEETTLIANALSNLGSIEFERGNYEAALSYYGRGAALGVAVEPSTLASILSNMGLVHRLQGRPDLAREALTRSLDLSESLGAQDQVALALFNLGLVERYQGNTDKALEYYERSLAMREASGNRGGVSLVMNSIGLLHHNRGRSDLALDYYRRSLAISERLGNLPRVAQTLANLTTAYYATADYEQALAAARRAVDVARGIGHGGEALWTSLAAMGRAQWRLGRPDRARVLFEDALAALERMRAEAGSSVLDQQAFLESRLLAYHQITDLLAAEGDPAGALAYAERAKARVLLDVLQRGRVNITKAMTVEERTREEALRAELSSVNGRLRRERGRADRGRIEALEADVRTARVKYDAFQSGLYAAHPELKVQRGESPLFDIADAHAVLPDPHSAALEFVVSDERTLLFVLTRGADRSPPTLRVHRLGIARDELTALVTEFRTLITTRNLRVRELAARLFHLLLEPAADALAGKSSVVIVPDGALWDLPFQALQSAPDRYLIEDYAVSYAPSLTVLRETQRLARPAARDARGALLAFANPDLGVPSQTSSRMRLMGDLEPLPEAERQVEVLGKLYGEDRSRVYVGAAAREARAKAEAGGYRILHLATHGVLDDESPMASYVVLSQTDSTDEEDGLLEAWELMDLDLDADLVVLSACETGRGRFGPGEGVIGMSWAAFVAGSPATVVSLWKVEARSTTELMVEFHRQLLADPGPTGEPPSKAEALRRAALALIADSRYRHPFYWAGFVLVGDASPIGTPRS